MDRNFAWVATSCTFLSVATREGGVDRNDFEKTLVHELLHVATREGGVDRNTMAKSILSFKFLSPPARVAWIETLMQNDIRERD